MGRVGRPYETVLDMLDLHEEMPGTGRSRGPPPSRSCSPCTRPAARSRFRARDQGVATDTELRPFGEPEGCAPTPVTQLSEPDQGWTVTCELVHCRSALDIVKDQGARRYEDAGIDVGLRACGRYSWVAEDWASAWGVSAWAMSVGRAGALLAGWERPLTLVSAAP